MIRIKLVIVLMTSDCTELHLPKRIGSLVVSIKQDTNFNFQPAATFVFSSLKNCLI
jgi:hypothetical protein